ncbi:MAG: serine protease, partial [Chloroflexi bacterium]|nr:serine protease [Chloroflexota bacterium]
MYRPEPDPDKGQRQANLLFVFVLGGLIGASLAISVIVISRCGTSDRPPETVYAGTMREVTRVVEVPKVVTREVEFIRNIEVPVEVAREILVTREVEVPVEVVRDVQVIRNVEVPVDVIREIVVSRDVEVTREVEVTRVVLATPTPTATPSPTPEAPSTPAELIERVRDSVVRVEASTGGTLSFISNGSGFIFAVEGTTAFVATNHHLIDGKSSVEVQLRSSVTYDALVLGWDGERDVAVVSICCSSDFIALRWDDLSPSVGDSVVAIGYPDTDTGNLIATIGEILTSDELSMEHDLITHSAPLNAGSSGGPLFSLPGAQVVGINTARGIKT